MTDTIEPEPAALRPAGAVHLHEVPRRALLMLVLVLVLWTSNVMWARQAGDDVPGFTTWRMILAVPVLGVLLLAQRGQPRAEGIPGARHHGDAAMRAVVVATGVLFGISAYVNFLAINKTTLVNVGVIHALQPAVIAVVAGRWLGEHVDWSLVARVSVAIVGTVLVAAGSVGQGTWSLHGDLIAASGLVLNCGWFVAGRWARTRTTIDATSYMTTVFCAAAATLATGMLLTGRGLAVSWVILGFAALTAVVGTIAHTIMAWLHRYIPVSISSLFLLSQPALIAALAWIAFGESIAPIQIVGGAVVGGALAGIVLRSS
jgi:drug/metabolite transporter (DMT)-like permease